MKKVFSVLALLVVAAVVCFSSISVGAASKNSPTASTAKPKPTTTTHPRNSNSDPSAPTGDPDNDDDSSKHPSTVNPQDDSSEWFRTSTTLPYDPNDPNDPNNPNSPYYNGGNGGTGDSTTSPVTGDYVVYSVLIAAGLGLSSLFAYKKYTSKKK